MEYFEGLDFIAWGSYPEYDTFIYRGYKQPEGSPHAGEMIEFLQYGLQFNYSGRFSFSFWNRKPRIYEGAYAWITVLEEKLRYGSPPGETRHHRHVNFLGERVKRFFADGLIPTKPMAVPIPITRPDRFANQFDEMLDRLSQQRYQHATHLLEGLLFTMQHQPPAAGDHLTPRLRKLAIQVKDNPGREWNFEAEARNLCISYDHFRRMFRQTVHTAPGKYLMGCRMQWAAELLRTTTDPIKQIAETVGIPDLHYFTRLFSRQYKMPPVKYRHHLNEVTG